MQGVAGLVGVLVIVALLIKFWWVIAIIAIIAAATYLIAKHSKARATTRSPSRNRATSSPARATRQQTTVRRGATPARQGPGLIVNVSADSVPRRQRAARTPTIALAQLTRRPTQHPTDQTVFTAIDLETTGLDCDTDRIVEIGLVKFTADGQVLDEFATLVDNPGSSLEARDKHQINDADLAGAPSTAEALREAFALMAGTVLVAHNYEFEEGFLTTAAKRERLTLPDLFGVCTLQTSRRQLEGRAFSLTVMYKTATGEFQTQKHTALGDARAVREILLWLLRNAPKPLHLTKAPPETFPTTSAVECRISCRPVPLSNTCVADLLASFPQSTRERHGDPDEVENYLALLAECVEDGRLTFDEARSLTEQARRTRFSGNQLRDLHRQAWQSTFPDAKNSDWKNFSPLERREMYLLADALGLSDLAAEINSVISECAEPEPAAEARYLKGLRVSIVGDSDEIVALRERAESYGAKLAVNITKTVVWLATTTPNAADAKHNTARKLGIPVLSPAQASERLGEAIHEAELKAFERQREIDASIARRAQYDAEREAYWRPTWRQVELDHDPEPRLDWY